MNASSILTPLNLGQIRPRGDFADRLRAAWTAGLVEGTPAWVRHGLLVGEGRGNLLVKGWAKRSGVDDLNAAADLGPRDASTAWADDVEAQTRSGQLGLDEYVCQSVWNGPGGLAVALYGPVTAKAVVAGVPVELVVDTPNPDAKVVEVEVFPEAPVEFTLSFRLPGWSSGCLVMGQGAAGVDVEDHDGWIELRRPWNRGDQLTLRFD
jgi:hypothetical protein